MALANPRRGAIKFFCLLCFVSLCFGCEKEAATTITSTDSGPAVANPAEEAILQEHKDNLSAEESPGELTDKIDSVNENRIKKKTELIELIKKVPYPDQPSKVVLKYLKETESFLELEKHSDELLNYALDLLQDKKLTLRNHLILGYVLLGIDFEKYKYLLRDVAVLFVEGKIDDLIAGFLFFPAEPGYGAYRNPEDPVIKEALEIYIKSDKVSDRTKSSIKRKIN